MDDNAPLADFANNLHPVPRGAAMPSWRWWLPAGLLGLLFGLVAAVLWLRSEPPRYTASMVIAPTARSGIVGMGLRVPVSRAIGETQTPNERHRDELVSDFEHFRQLLTAPAVAAALTGDEGFMRRLRTDLWREPPAGWRSPASLPMRRWSDWLTGRQGGPDPNDGAVFNSYRTRVDAGGVELSDWLKHRVELARIGESAMFRVSFRHPDRAVAMETLQRLSDSADRLMRREAVRRVDVQMAHIRDELGKTALTAQREALSELLAEQLQLSMMLAVDLPYAADRIEPPTAPIWPDWPAPLPVLAVSMLAGLALSQLLVFGWFNRRSANAG